MKKLILTTLLLNAGVFAQSVETVPFRAVLSSANEVQSVSVTASGAATLWVHVMRDAGGEIVSASVDFNVAYNLPGETTFTGLHIHRGPAGANGPVVIGALTSADQFTDAGGQGTVRRQAQVAPDSASGLAALRDMMSAPEEFYVNLHTSADPAGAIRGQLQRAESIVLMTLLSPLNEVPPIMDLDASGVASIVALRTFDGSGNLTSGQVTFEVDYNFPAPVTFTGLHIHEGAADESGPVVISSGLSSTPSADSGAGTIRMEAEIDVTSERAVDELNDLFAEAPGYYVNLHTTDNPSGALRGQLRYTGRANFQTTLLPSNEVPPLEGLDASAGAQFDVSLLREADGSVSAARVVFDVNYRFPGAVEFTGLHIHNGSFGTNGPVSISSGISGTGSVVSDSGFGNIYLAGNVTSSSGLAAVNSLLANPEKHYMNLHSKVNPSGAVRAQVGVFNPALPIVNSALSSADPSASAVAPLGLMTISGRNFTKVAADLSGFDGVTAPTLLNGTEVTVGGQKAPLVIATSTDLIVQVPGETAAGSQLVVVSNANGLGVGRSVMVAPAAPALFFDEVGGLIQKNSDFSLVRPENAAVAGDVLLIYSTGLGLTTPEVATGKVVAYPPLSSTAPVTVSIGGQPATVIYSAASPGFLGLYQTAVVMPSGVPPGAAEVILQQGEAVSNTVSIAVQ